MLLIAGSFIHALLNFVSSASSNSNVIMSSDSDISEGEILDKEDDEEMEALSPLQLLYTVSIMYVGILEPQQ